MPFDRRTMHHLVTSRNDCPECGYPLDDGPCQFCEVVEERAQLVRGINEMERLERTKIYYVDHCDCDQRWYVFQMSGDCNDDRHADTLLELIRKLGESTDDQGEAPDAS